MRAPCWIALAIALVLGLPARSTAQTRYKPPPPPPNPYPYAANEPRGTFSLAKSTEYLDGVARFWMDKNSCGACHVNFPYLMARPLLPGPRTPLVPETRNFMLNRKTTHNAFFSDAEKVGIAFALAWHDSRTTGKLQPDTRQALRRMWSVQKPTGTWMKMGCGSFPPLENDFVYTATLAALAAGIAPEGYARTAEARAGLTRVRGYLAKVRGPDLHHHSMLLWASLYVENLMTPEERQQTIKALLASQKKDGGWSLVGLRPSLARLIGESPSSDGYGTGFAIFVLRQAGVSASRPEIARGVRWLQNNQRASGRWFTPSHAAGDPTEGGVGARDLYIQSLGTAFAVLALDACGVPQRAAQRMAPRRAGLALRTRLLLD
jgi:squalene-hopene/tetraprenyl-beta-curcumene cyclase